MLEVGVQTGLTQLYYKSVYENVTMRKYLKVVQEYERAVIFRLGRLKRGGTTVGGWEEGLLSVCCLYCTVLSCAGAGPLLRDALH